MFCRQRSTLIRLNFGPKDGEHLKILDFGVRKLDIPAPHLYFQAPGGQCFQLIGINEDRSYYKGAGDGPNVAKEKEAEALKDEAMNKLALGHHQKKSRNNPSEYSTSVPINVLASSSLQHERVVVGTSRRTIHFPHSSLGIPCA